MERKYPAEPPKVTVDVLSPEDRLNRMMVKIGQFLAGGVQLVWIIDPEARDVTVHRPGKQPYMVRAGDELTGDEVLPEFRCRVDEFFARRED